MIKKNDFTCIDFVNGDNIFFFFLAALLDLFNDDLYMIKHLKGMLDMGPPS